MRTEEEITIVLQEVEDNINKACRICSRILALVKQNQLNVESIQQSQTIWQTFLQSIQSQTILDTSVSRSMLDHSIEGSIRSEEGSVDSMATPRLKTCRAYGKVDTSLHIESPKLFTPSHATTLLDAFAGDCPLSPVIPNETVSLEQSISSMPDSPQLNSPLASTAMMAMTPRTPISNQRLLHSASRRPFLSVDDNEGPCVFEISAFPPYFQHGAPREQLTDLYNLFTQYTKKKALTIQEIHGKMPHLPIEKAEVFIEMMVTRNFLFPCNQNGVIAWRLPLN